MARAMGLGHKVLEGAGNAANQVEVMRPPASLIEWKRPIRDVVSFSAAPHVMSSFDQRSSFNPLVKNGTEFIFETTPSTCCPPVTSQSGRVA
ncbi:hypothetical protein CDAR_241261 [Caerostris darwini]|uniref:Uncharacterized protein n=1 Tax=Caerostris darwini TaxID=1538125 RepID=A0AAV4TFF9_9ARAC|nr:hypothetical protein CDAR_241261 [Caerostris darwini]